MPETATSGTTSATKPTTDQVWDAASLADAMGPDFLPSLLGYEPSIPNSCPAQSYDQLDAPIEAAIDVLSTHLGAIRTDRPRGRLTPSPRFQRDPNGAIARITSPSFGKWRDHVAKARGCTRPIRLSGSSTTMDTRTGEALHYVDTAGMPDGVIYKPCGSRRESVCPACARTYRFDAYQLIRAGIAGGKGITDNVAAHPAVFLTLTAPSFGAIHSRVVRRHTCSYRAECSCMPDVCRPRRDRPLCPHGKPASCHQRHRRDDHRRGQPLCLDCYDHEHQVIWNHYAGKLWSRTFITLGRILAAETAPHGVDVKVRYAKVAEYQHRGVIHFHAILRLDGTNPDGYTAQDPAAIFSPPSCITAQRFAELIRRAASVTALRTPSHPDKPEGWPLAWGTQIDIRVVPRGIADAAVTEAHVAGYLAKYATKSTEPTGLVAQRLTDRTVEDFADEHTHTGRLIDACWRLGRTTTLTSFDDLPPWPRQITETPQRASAAAEETPPSTAHASQKKQDDNPFGKLRRWAHMLGFGGHFCTKSRLYSVTFGQLRAARRPGWRGINPTAIHPAALSADHDTETTLVIGHWTYHGTGWLTTGDAALALQAANAARERQPAVTA